MGYTIYKLDLRWSRTQGRGNVAEGVSCQKLIFVSNVIVHWQFSATPCLLPKPNTHTPPHIAFPSRQRPVSSKVWKRRSGTIPTSTYWQPQRKVPGEAGPWTITWNRIGPPALIPALRRLGGVGFQKMTTKRRDHFELYSKEGSRFGVGSDPVGLTSFLNLGIQLSARSLWNSLLEIGCMSNHHTCRTVKANKKSMKTDIYTLC